MLIIVIINVNDLDLDSVIQCLYLINNLQESLINLFIYLYLFIHMKDRYSAVRLISNCIKLRTSQTISGPILCAVEVSQGDKMQARIQEKI